MEEKFNSSEILNAVEEILNKKKDKIENIKKNPKIIKNIVPIDTENIILQAEKFLKK
tara:strand:+ start:339 stop:509 length:171 start_codon:yes stop_codon:yes gene_type:complete